MDAVEQLGVGLVVDTPTPALAAAPETSVGLPPELDDSVPFFPRRPRPENPGLPERPHKRIKEKFRLDRERLEQTLNAKGDSLYRSKLRPPTPPPQEGGYLREFGSGWGNPPPTLIPGFSWGGGPAQNPFGWGAGPGSSMGPGAAPTPQNAAQPQQEPMDSAPTGQPFQGGSMEALFKNYREVGGYKITNASDNVSYVNENYSEEEKVSEEQSGFSAENAGRHYFNDGISGRGESENPLYRDQIDRDKDFVDGVDGRRSREHERFDFVEERYNNPLNRENIDQSKEFVDGVDGRRSREFEKFDFVEERYNNPLNRETVAQGGNFEEVKSSKPEGFDFLQEGYNKEEYGGRAYNQGEENYSSNDYQMPSDQMEDSDQVRLEGEEVAGDGTAMTVSGFGGDEGAEGGELQRPRRQLKEKFMRDREALETKMNSKGDSIYRRAGDPIPDHLQAEPGAVQGGYAPPRGGRRFLLPHELRAQRAIQKIAKIALRMQTRRRKKGGKFAGTPVVFL